ncbi:MGMT family protein [Actinotalea sp.]|uniref:MGMT family protein n=1 Tax=Actinotalea sp. TaxID=1872145 RepID=UPI002CF5741F|nr:MGMT family protein [Actinotalea sp.]HQY33051.1 MGMT family protein [Actinotalea sp.]HRA51022.1 MGMT family protein [Actinotalea sp.]
MSRTAGPGATPTREDYLEAVLDLVERIPAGRAMTYGTVAEVLRDELGVGGPRQVGQVMARAGSDVPWWRVVNAAGRPPAALRTEALDRLRADGCPLSDDGGAHDVDARVVLRRALWWPDEV